VVVRAARNRAGRKLDVLATQTESDDADYCEIKLEGLHCLLVKPPAFAAPSEIGPLGIEFLAPVSPAAEWVQFRNAISELVGFLLGRHLIHLGYTRFSEKAMSWRALLVDHGEVALRSRAGKEASPGSSRRRHGPKYDRWGQVVGPPDGPLAYLAPSLE